MSEKINSLIQFAKRANKIAYKQTLPHYLNKNKVGLIIISNDISKNTLDEFKSYNKVSILPYLSKDELGNILGKDQVSIFGILDPNLAKAIKKLLEGGKSNG